MDVLVTNSICGLILVGRANKRDQLLDTAEQLFARDGYNATGVNQITDSADVATMTLYNNFKNKEELIVAMLERRADRFRGLFDTKIAKAEGDPYQQILIVFDVVDAWVRAESKSEDGFSGCAFIKAAVEFRDSSNAARNAALIQKKDILRLFERLLKEAGYSTVKEMALELLLLLDGGVTQVQVLGNSKSIKRARSMAERLLESD